MVEIIMPLDINLFCNDEINHLIYETIFYQNDESDILSGIVNLFLPDESYNDYYDKNNITTVFDFEITPVNFRRAWDMSRACTPIIESPISPSISALGTSAATE